MGLRALFLLLFALAGMVPALSWGFSACIGGVPYPPSSNICGSSSGNAPNTQVGTQVTGVLLNSGGGQNVRVPIGTNDRGDCPVGWSNCGPGQTPTPPSTVSQSTYWKVSGSTGVCLPDQGSACADWAGQSAQSAPGQCCHGGGCAVYTVSGAPGCGIRSGGFTVCGSGIGTCASCPAGYTVSGSNCNLSNGSAVQKPTDGTCSVVRTGNVYAVDPQDPDCGSGSGTAATALGVSVSGGTVTAGDASATFTVAIDSGTGAATITVATAGTSTTTSTVVSVGQPTNGSGGTVNGVATTNSSGTGNQAGNGNGTEGNCGAPGQPPCKIDESGTPAGTGFNATAIAALEAVTPATLGKSAWDGKGPSPLSGLPSVAGSDSCTNPISWTWAGQSLTLDICSIWSPLKVWLAWLLYAMTGLYIWRRLTGALGGD